jgi:hypothetical protein
LPHALAIKLLDPLVIKALMPTCRAQSKVETDTRIMPSPGAAKNPMSATPSCPNLGEKP